MRALPWLGHILFMHWFSGLLPFLYRVPQLVFLSDILVLCFGHVRTVLTVNLLGEKSLKTLPCFPCSVVRLQPLLLTGVHHLQVVFSVLNLLELLQVVHDLSLHIPRGVPMSVMVGP